MTGSRFVDLLPWPGDEWEKAHLVLLGVRWKWLSFGWFEWGCVKFFLKANIAKVAVFEVKCVFWPVDWNWNGPSTNPYIKFSLVLCVHWWCGQTGGGALESANVYFSWGSKNWVCWHYQVEKAVWYNTNVLWILCTLRLYPFMTLVWHTKAVSFEGASLQNVSFALSV